MPNTLPGKLAAEIKRVTELKDTYASMRGMPQCNVEPTIFMMEQSLKSAIEAAGSPDVEGQIRAVRDLEGFTK